MSDPSVYNAILQQNKQLQNSIQEERIYAIDSLTDAATIISGDVTAAALQGLGITPWEPANWSALPLLESPVGCLCVLDGASGCMRCGASCTWTVPAATTKAQFQLWGPGAGTGNGQCCSGSPFGANGAYATTIIDVTPGDTYDLCAGCAYCCYASATSQSYSGITCSTTVTGNGLTGLCAQGGMGNLACGMKDFHDSYIQCRWRGEGSGDTQGPCLCAAGTWYCFGGSCSTCTIVPFIASTEFTYNGSSTGTEVIGLPSIYGGGCIDGNHYGYFTSPPVIGPCHTVQTCAQCKCETFTSGSCCGGCRCQANTSYKCVPGAGGTWTHMMGGSTSWAGDAGRGGMVRVSWC
jgi:hypothetical protein